MSKFQPVDFYRNQTGRYELLPFRFERLCNGEVVVTNAAGEFAYLTPDKLEALVNHRLPVSDPNYALLRSRHFIKEDGDAAGLELLALKVRTKFSRLRDFTNLHLFVVTLRCDHSCQYCQVSRQSEDKAAFDMTVETANKALDLVFRSPNKAIKIEFQGGEPLLNFELVRYVVKKAEQRNQQEQRDLQFVITTTLALVTDEILDFCRDQRIYLSCSLDGPEDLHNKNRPRPGKG
jgi:sulfatase maturation enzyme AslB (radical SAM superfamily)